MAPAGNNCADCGQAFDLTSTVFRASGGRGLRCGRCERKARVAATCARADGCDVRTLCQTISCCASRNPNVVLELARRIGGEPEGTVIVARRRAS